MVTIGSLNFIIVEESFENLVRINVTETWLIEMSVHNVTFRQSGTYTFTVGFKDLRRELKMNEDILIIDPEKEINLITIDKNGCKTVICFSEYNVQLLGPDGNKSKTNTCLSEMDTGIFSCCFSDKMVCTSVHCKSIYVPMSNDIDAYNMSSSTTENTTHISAIWEVDAQNTGNLNMSGVTTICSAFIVYLRAVFFDFG